LDSFVLLTRHFGFGPSDVPRLNIFATALTSDDSLQSLKVHCCLYGHNSARDEKKRGQSNVKSKVHSSPPPKVSVNFIHRLLSRHRDHQPHPFSFTRHHLAHRSSNASIQQLQQQSFPAPPTRTEHYHRKHTTNQTATMSGASSNPSSTTAPQDTKATPAPAARTAAAGAQLEEDDEFEDFPVEGGTMTLPDGTRT
jgi:hypothetical protein